jgi:hypothetical protein
MFSSSAKLLSSSWFFPKLHGHGLLVLLLLIGQHAHLSYSTPWLFVTLRFLSSPPYPRMFFVLIIKCKEGGEGGGGYDCSEARKVG